VRDLSDPAAGRHTRVRQTHSAPALRQDEVALAALHPLSCGQERLWFLDRLHPGGCAYNVPMALRLRGDLRAQALREALDAIVARHEALRTTFVLGPEGPRAVVSAPSAAPLPVRDLSRVPDEAREAEIARLLRQEARRPFDLGADRMLRASLLRAGEQDHVLLLVLHHIATDGWSMTILGRELAALYAAAVGGRPADLPVLPIQYTDYARWEREWLRSEQPARELAYWKERLAGMPDPLRIPAGGPEPPLPGVRGARAAATLPEDLRRALAALSRRERVTLFMTLAAAFAILVHRYAGTDDVVFGTAIAGRRRAETEPLIGFFVNTLVLRTDLAGDPPFRDLLRRVRETVVEACDHQDLPFERLVQELRPERAASRTPLFNVMFVLQEPDPRHLTLPGLTVTPVDVDTGAAKFDLTAFVTPTPHGLTVTLEYDTGVYGAAAMRRMLGHYETLLAGIAGDPERSVSRLPLLTEPEREQMRRWNATRREYPAHAGIPALFEAQAARTPHAAAVVAGEHVLTYEALNIRANRLAHRLRRHGVGPGTVVGVCLPRGPDAIVALLGILKAGGAYVPLDPGYPRARLRFMVEDARAAAVVTHRRLAGAFPPLAAPAVLLDTAPEQEEPADNPAPGTTGEHAAYLMYTSGSTGEPKAVAVPHRGVARLVLNTDYVSLTPADAVAQASTLSFDAATFEIWGALLNGARLVVVPRDTLLSPAALAAEIARRGITVLFLTTGLFNQMAQEAPSAFRTLRTLLVGGEAASPACVAAVLEHGAPGRLVNAYGPTETTTFASWYLVDHVPAGATGIPIGRPIANTQIYLLDRAMNPVPIGVPGEIYIGGPGVAQGYAGRPELTRERFIPDPFGDDPGGRLYRTGDLARYLPDGNIEFLGRLDEQVKIRGHRIEPGEVEAALRRHPAVRDVLVLPREIVPGDTRLVAYVVAAPGPRASPRDLRAFLRDRLPGYMIPAHIVPLDALPLTANGKVDRRALPAPAAARRDAVGGPVEPRDPLEQQLQQIWESLLGVRPIGVTDNFFDLGGHSLLAVRLLQAIEAATGCRVPLAALFEGATIRGLARVVGEHRPAAWTPVTAFHAGGPRPPFFFLHGDFSGGGFYCRTLARALGPDQPFFALHPHGLDGRPVPETIESMAEEHLATMRALQPRGPYRLGGHCNGGLIAFEMARRLEAQGEEVECLILLDASAENARTAYRLLHALVEGLGALRGLTRRQRQAWLLRLRRRAEGIRAALRHSPARLFAAAGPDVSPAPAAGPEADDRMEVYRLVIAGYVPKRYRGRVILFRSGARPKRRPDLGWRRVASNLAVCEVPGDHLTSITRHAAALGERLRACLAPPRPP
jgi:amino acid adenylation domain-containing protein